MKTLYFKSNNKESKKYRIKKHKSKCNFNNYFSVKKVSDEWNQ